MEDFIDTLASDSRKSIEAGYYSPAFNFRADFTRTTRLSLKSSILNCRKNAIIAEVKRSSPSKGRIKGQLNQGTDPSAIASLMERGGASGISVLTEPLHFGGSLQDLIKVRKNASIPVLMKDIILSKSQINAASKIGADAVLLIQTVFERRYAECDLGDMIGYVHSRGMEVMLESHTEGEFRKAINSGADMIGINNRDLKTLVVDIHNTAEVLEKFKCLNRVIVSESGISCTQELRFLRNAGAKAFLIGTSILSSGDVERKTRQLVEA